MHGAWTGAWTFERWQPWFAAAGWRTFAMSLRNHPGSYAVDEASFRGLTSFDYVEDVLTVADWIAEPLVLIGHSMGGPIVQKAAETLRLRALVLLGAAMPQQLGSIREVDLPTDRLTTVGREEAHEFFHDVEDAVFDSFFARLVPESPTARNYCGGGRTPVDPALVGAPVLAIDGAFDRDMHFAKRLAVYFGGEYLIVPDTGHNLMLERSADDVAMAINRWLLANLPDQGLALPLRASPR